MKRLLTIMIITVLQLGSNTYGQISTPIKSAPRTTVGKIAPLGSFTAELSYQKSEQEGTDTIYSLSFRNAKYSHITSVETVHFSSEGNTVNELYKVFKSVFLPENKNNKDYMVHFTLGKTDVAISTFKNMGITSAMFFCNGAYFTLVDKQVDKLFGK